MLLTPLIPFQPCERRVSGGGFSSARRIFRRGAALHVLALAALLGLAQAPLAQAQIQVGATRGSGALPALGDNSELSTAAERRIGDRIAASIYRDPDYIDDPVLVDYVQSIWLPLKAAARARGELSAELDERFAWQIFLIRDRSINAFALPGGYFGVHLGLIGAVSSADEMAAVLAHEMSHVTQRHISRLMTQQSRQAPWMIAAMVLGALAASKSPNAGMAAVVGGQALAAQGQLDFSRDMEREADRVGFGVMTDAGFESQGAAQMFERLQQANRLNDNGAFPYLRSHPLTTERIAEARARVQLVSATKPSAQALADEGRAQVLHAMMAARARILVQPGVDTLRATVTEAQRRASGLAALQTPASADNIRAAGALYGGVLAAAQLRDFAAAQSLLARLKSLTEGIERAHTATTLLATELALLQGPLPADMDVAALPKEATRAELLMRARVWMAGKRAGEASQSLRVWVAEHAGDAMAWQLLAQAYGQQGKNVQAIRAEAESRAAQRDYTGALDRLKAAQILLRSQPASADYVEASILDSRTRQIDLLVKEQALQDKVNR